MHTAALRAPRSRDLGRIRSRGPRSELSDAPVPMAMPPTPLGRLYMHRDDLRRRFRLCGLRWTPKPGKVQGIEKTCRLNPAVSNFLDPTPRRFPPPRNPAISRPDCPSSAIAKTDPRLACLHNSLLSCKLGINHVNGLDPNFFARCTPKARRGGDLEPGRGLRGGAAGGDPSPGRGVPGRMDRGRPQHPPALLSAISPVGPADVPIGASAAIHADSQAPKATYRTNRPSCHGISSNQGSCRIGGQHVACDLGFKRPGDVGTKADDGPVGSVALVPWFPATMVMQAVPATGSQGSMVDRPPWSACSLEEVGTQGPSFIGALIPWYQ